MPAPRFFLRQDFAPHMMHGRHHQPVEHPINRTRQQTEHEPLPVRFQIPQEATVRLARRRNEFASRHVRNLFAGNFLHALN